MMKYYTTYLFVAFIALSCLLSCNNDDKVEVAEVETNNTLPKLLHFIIKAENNPYHLSSDINSELIGDSIIECWIPNITEDKLLSVNISAVADKIFLDGVPYVLGEKYDFKKPVELTLYNNGLRKSYEVYVFSFTGLPVVWIETEGRDEIISKEEYLKASFKLVENVVTRSSGDVIVDSVMIKGRGTSSWNSCPKKSYRLKFNNKISLLDEPKDKSWVLIANHFDKTLIRNKIAYCLGDLSNLDYTPRAHFVELMLNGRYDGTYMLGEKLKISKNRVNVGDEGFLVEISSDVLREGGVFFWTDSLKFPVHIKEPDTIIEGDENYEYVKKAFQDAENVLFSDNFKDPINGWQKYLDINSFVDWWIIHEITKNADAIAFWKSCYLNLKRGEKLKIGPIWDFDLSFGNGPELGEYAIEGYAYIYYGNKWYKRLLEDPAFLDLLKERWDFFYNQKEYIIREINTYANYLRYSVIENESRWNVLYTTTYYYRDVWGSYNNEIQYMKNWLMKRMDWLNNAISQLN